MRRVKLSGGFTLIELMAVIAIVAVLMVFAIPAYQNQVIKTKRNVGEGGLMEVAARQEQFFVNNRRYASDLTNLGYKDGADGFELDSDGDWVTDGSDAAIYLITLPLVTTTTYTVKATRRNGQVNDSYCGNLTLTSSGTRSSDSNPDLCW